MTEDPRMADHCAARPLFIERSAVLRRLQAPHVYSSTLTREMP